MEQLIQLSNNKNQNQMPSGNGWFWSPEHGCWVHLIQNNNITPTRRKTTRRPSRKPNPKKIKPIGLITLIIHAAATIALLIIAYCLLTG